MNTKIVIFFSLFFNLSFFSQVSITSSNYTQNFGTTTRATWVDNSTFAGWYLTAGGTFAYGGTQNITTAAPTNTGGFYTYQSNNDGNIKLGSRPSNTSGGTSGSGQSHIGLRLVNNTGQTIESITVSYRGYQLSLAENGTGNTNKFTFSYRISSTANSSLTSGTFTNVSNLDYNAPNNSSTAGSNQVLGYPSTVNSLISFCVNTASIPDGSELMLRWTDINNTNNDHHLAIDDVQVFFSFDEACAVTLPVELINFEGKCENNLVNLNWATASERNNDFFEIHGSQDGITFELIEKIIAVGDATHVNFYNFSFENEKYTYLKLKQQDLNGVSTELENIFLDCKDKNKLTIFPNPTRRFFTIQNIDSHSEILLLDSSGKIILKEISSRENYEFDLHSLSQGIYFVQIMCGGKITNNKIVLTK